MGEGSVSVSKDMIMSLTKPVVFHGMIEDWDALKWSLTDWKVVFGDEALPFRCGVKSCSLQPVWEQNCSKEAMTLKEFADLCCNPADLEDSGKWFYFDYKYIREWVPGKKNVLKSITWSKFGFPDMGADESTIWIGTGGAHTPCHYDTYGCNLVAQVFGTKRWFLFPQEESKHLKLSRIPYEESSIYSKWNFNCPLPPDFYEHCSQVYIIDLKPGDVLFVPRHWWHYVECLEPSISINSWIPTCQDDTSRLDEALVRLTISHISKNVSDSDKNIMLNPNEVDVPSIELRNSTDLILYCINDLKRSKKEKEEVTEPPVKQAKLQLSEPTSIVETLNCAEYVPCSSTDKLKNIINEKCNCISTERHKSLMKEECAKMEPPGMLSKQSETELEKVVNAYCHPDVISKVREKLHESFSAPT